MRGPENWALCTMLYHGLPAIPEDDVLDELVMSRHNFNENPSHRFSNKNRVAYISTNVYPSSGSSDDSNSGSLSPFGYVAILRNDTILLEVGRSAFDIYDDSSSYNEENDGSVDDDFTATTELDQTILGLLDQLPNPGWDRYSSARTKNNSWIGLRFHYYDYDYCGEEKRYDNGDSDRLPATTIWSFCVVYTTGSTIVNGTGTPQEASLELIMQEWMMEHLVQFTHFFRQNDVVWKTGTTLSCQYVFAPVLQQRMMALHQQYQQRRAVANPSENSYASQSSLNWMDIADEIVEKNREVLRNASVVTSSDDDTTQDKRVGTMSGNNSDVPPFVSDDSDNEEDEDLCEHQHAFVEDDDAVTSSSEEEEDDDLLSSTPVRTGALPIHYFYNNNPHLADNDNDGNFSYLDRIVASTTSVWTKHSDVKHLSASEIISPVHPIDTVTMHVDVSKTTGIDHHNSDGMDSDDETIPLICFVGDQVDAQHSDLWKRSPKCISKAVALGSTNVSPPPTKTMAEQEPTVLLPTSQPPSIVTSNIERKPWWGLLWTNVTTRFYNSSDTLDESSNDNNISKLNTDQTIARDHDDRHPCFWCESIFPSKASALQ